MIFIKAFVVITIGIKTLDLISTMATIKYDILLLDQNTRFSIWHVKMRAILSRMDLDDALLRFDKMPLSWTKDKKQRKCSHLNSENQRIVVAFTS